MRLLPNRRASIDQAPAGLKSVLVRQAIDALQSRMLNTGSGDGYERVLLALSVIPPESAEGSSEISPQHFNGIFLPGCTEQDGCFHLSRLLLPHSNLRNGTGAQRHQIVALEGPEVTRRNTRVNLIRPLKERIVREVGYGLALEGASAADLVKSMQAKSERVAQKGKSA